MLFTTALSGQAGMTIVINTPCFGQVTMTFSGTDATGRHIYGNEAFNGVGNPVFSIFWDQASGSWVMGLLGTGSASDILYATGPNAFSPNPPDSATEPFVATAAGGCGAVSGGGTATVSGDGTQTMAGTPCDGVGDDDSDGICNDNDVCAGEDDTIDADMDNIADCIDPLEIAFNTTDNRWEMRGSAGGGAVIYFNTLASIPDPPATDFMDWEGVPENGCTDIPTVGGSGTLPVEWLSFSANAGAKKVDLKWETSEEPDNSGFHIERSANGRAWSVLGEQAPLAGNTYDFTDATPLVGDNYYRIRQTDFDGTTTYSPVEVANFTGNLVGLLVAPNPATDVFTVRIPASFGDKAQLLLFDITGREVRMNPTSTESG